MANRKFYRTVFQIEVLSEEPLPDPISLSDIAYEITEGHCSGMFLDTKSEELSGPDMAAYLRKQGSDPEFFQLDDDGKDLSDD